MRTFFKIFKLFIINFIFVFSIHPFPGDHNSLTCDKNFIGLRATIDNAANTIVTDDIKDANGNIKVEGILTQFYRKDPALLTTTGFTNRANIVKAIQADLALSNSVVKQKIRLSHDLSVDVTKLGDSLSDFVDFYGRFNTSLLDPALNAMGIYGGFLPNQIDSWDDYYTIYGGSLGSPFKVSNYAREGNTTIDLLNLLGVGGPLSDEYNWDVDLTKSKCLTTRGGEYTWVANYVDPIHEDPAGSGMGKSGFRSVIMIGGNDTMRGFLSTGAGAWLPFNNQFNIDMVLANIGLIVDWHIENGKKVFLEGTIPIFSHPAPAQYNLALVNRQTLCKSYKDLTVENGEVPWWAFLFPGTIEAGSNWNDHVYEAIARFYHVILFYTEKPAGINGIFYTLEEFLNNGIEQLTGDGDKSIEEEWNDPITRFITTVASINQACLNDRIANNLAKTYRREYPNNFEYKTLYSDFNLTLDVPYAKDFWVPNTYELYRQEFPWVDIIHIGPKGYALWGDLMGKELKKLGWNLSPSQSEIDSAKIDISFETFGPGSLIRKKSIEVGVFSTESGKLVKVTANSDFGGAYKEYANGSGIYVKQWAADAVDISNKEKFKQANYVSGGIYIKYKQLGGPTGSLGFPISDTQCWGPGAFCTTKVTFFENGHILHDETPVLGGISAYSVPFTLSREDQLKDPDFDSCISGCGGRWFEHIISYLIPKAGLPPYRWSVVSGALPSGTKLEATGVIQGGPTNNPSGNWVVKVRLTDGRGKTVEKDIRYGTGM